MAVVTLLPEVLRASWPGFDPVLRWRLDHAWGTAVQDSEVGLGGFLRDHGLGVRLGDFGVGPEHLEALALAAAVPGRLDNHATPLEPVQLVEILRGCL